MDPENELNQRAQEDPTEDLANYRFRTKIVLNTVLPDSTPTPLVKETSADLISQLEATLPNVDLHFGEITDGVISREAILKNTQADLTSFSRNFPQLEFLSPSIEDIPSGIKSHTCEVLAYLSEEDFIKLTLHVNKQELGTQPYNVTANIRKLLTTQIDKVRKLQENIATQIEKLENLNLKGTALVTTAVGLAIYHATGALIRIPESNTVGYFNLANVVVLSYFAATSLAFRIMNGKTIKALKKDQEEIADEIIDVREKND